MSQLPIKMQCSSPSSKKYNLDPIVLFNFRPISKLPFLSKVLEKVVNEHLRSFFFLEKFQSVCMIYKQTRFLNDLLLTVDSGNSEILVPLDLTAAFDTLDHNIVLSRLNTCVGIKGRQESLPFYFYFLLLLCFTAFIVFICFYLSS